MYNLLILDCFEITHSGAPGMYMKSGKLSEYTITKNSLSCFNRGEFGSISNLDHQAERRRRALQLTGCTAAAVAYCYYCNLLLLLLQLYLLLLLLKTAIVERENREGEESN